MNSKLLKCPNCKNLLHHIDLKSFTCVKQHSFDLAKEGYVNLLLPNQKKAKLPGDNKEMITNRETFLSLGYYDSLADAILHRITNMVTNKSSLNILDLGCGSGFYLRQLPNENVSKIGLDISKYAVTKAAKLDKNSLYIVGSYKNIPLVDKSINVVVSNFAPLVLDEVVRVLKSNGILIKIIPYKNHMRQLAELIYDKFRPHTSNFIESITSFDELEITRNNTITSDYTFPKVEALKLLGMTPYYHKFKFLNIELPEEITVTFSFQIIVVQKK